MVLRQTQDRIKLTDWAAVLRSRMPTAIKTLLDVVWSRLRTSGRTMAAPVTVDEEQTPENFGEPSWLLNRKGLEAFRRDQCMRRSSSPDRQSAVGCCRGGVAAAPARLLVAVSGCCTPELTWIDRVDLFPLFPLLQKEARASVQLGSTSTVFLWIYGLLEPVCGLSC